MNTQLDTKDQANLEKIVAVREQIPGPRVGDFVLFDSGQLERISHDWGDALQTSPAGSIYLCQNGHGSFSGGMNPATPMVNMKITAATLPGEFWFFHHGIAGGGQGVYFQVPCRVYQSTAPYEGFMSGDFQSPQNSAIREELVRQIGTVSIA